VARPPRQVTTAVRNRTVLLGLRIDFPPW
jgi:hypothetical protein